MRRLFRRSAILARMVPSSMEHRDPTLAAALSTVVPGLGLVYAGRVRAGVLVLAVEVLAFAAGWGLLLPALHLWQIAIAGGEASVRAARTENVIARARAAAAVAAHGEPG